MWRSRIFESSVFKFQYSKYLYQFTYLINSWECYTTLKFVPIYKGKEFYLNSMCISLILERLNTSVYAYSLFIFSFHWRTPGLLFPLDNFSFAYYFYWVIITNWLVLIHILILKAKPLFCFFCFFFAIKILFLNYFCSMEIWNLWVMTSAIFRPCLNKKSFTKVRSIGF